MSFYRNRAKRESLAALEADVTGSIAPARYVPLHAMRDAFWERWGAAA
jgi:hypothetical protein